jgi:Protein of unknown function (DUF2911)
MKNLKSIALVILLFAGISELASAQKLPGLDPSPADISYFRPNGRNTAPLAKVTYGRPSKKGRTMLGGVEPFGQVWRLGANEATEIKLYQEITFGDKTLKAGTYSVYAIPTATEWTIIFNTKLDTWGAYDYDKALDVARIQVPVGKTDSEVEAFTITFEGKDAMLIAWENTLVKVPVKY